MTIHGRGLICTPLPESRGDELGLEAMVSRSTDPKETAFTVSVDLLGDGVSTGISANDRARTILALMDEKSKPTDFMRPGHIFPLRAKEGGVLKRAGHTEAAIDLTRLAGLKEGGVICEIMNEDGTMARLPQLAELAQKQNLKIVSIEDLIEYRLKNGDLIDKIEEREVKTFYGDDEVLVRVQSSGSYFDVLIILANGEKSLLEKITAKINEEGRGVIVFINNVSTTENTLRKLQQFINNQENKEVKNAQNFKDYGIGIQIIKELGIHKIKILSQNIDQKPIVSGYDVEITEMVKI